MHERQRRRTAMLENAQNTKNKRREKIMKKIKIRITTMEEMLGSAPSQKDLHEAYIASKAPDAKKLAEEIEAIGEEAVVEKGMTVFPRHEGKPIMYDYQMKGFFKDSCQALRKVPGSESSKIKAFKKEIDGLIFVSPRHIEIQFDGEMGDPGGGCAGDGDHASDRQPRKSADRVAGLWRAARPWPVAQQWQGTIPLRNSERGGGMTMKYEIVIRNVETGAEELRHECGEYAVLAMTEEGEPSTVDIKSTADHMADAMVTQAPVRAACWLAIAKHEATMEIHNFENKRRLGKLADIFAGALNED